MSLAVEQTLPSREVEKVDRRESGSHAAEPYMMDAPRSSTAATSRSEAFASAAPATRPTRSSYDMQRQYQDAMADHEITTPLADSHVVEEQAPVLPQKSALRASRLLVGLKISPSAEPLELAQTHHEEYLSSEEDASSTSGDFSDFEYDSSSDDLPSPTEECSKHEVTARVVSVIFSGKPSVIEVPQVRRSISPASIERPASMGGLSTRTSYIDSAKSRRVSISTTASSRSSRSPHPTRPLPPRSSSMQPPTDAMKAKLGFLRIDPYANGSSYSLGPILTEPIQSQETPSAEEPERPKTPKSPGNMFRGVARAMSLMKRRSVPRLNSAYLAPEMEIPSQPSSPTPTSIPEESSPEEPMKQEVTQSKPEREIEVAAIPPPPSRQPPKPQLQPVTHDEIIRIAKRNEQNRLLHTARTFHGEQMLESPISPMSPLTKDTNTTTKRISSFGFGRRRMSVKLTGKFQL
ncbi:hypothetical protein N0V93_006118 [Gnomoniopsis smithogilvyi]|uniref:Uncharacterized protein n=1 Tax=Gnomoniopsis smithogilvyi TaxID=1191159 RepID=A0A9W8YP89_9PEZI|nr:hypothetical protein N0V93_006118 [Gnomoniopsis smithogilvyi]